MQVDNDAASFPGQPLLIVNHLSSLVTALQFRIGLCEWFVPFVKLLFQNMKLAFINFSYSQGFSFGRAMKPGHSAKSDLPRKFPLIWCVHVY